MMEAIFFMIGLIIGVVLDFVWFVCVFEKHKWNGYFTLDQIEGEDAFYKLHVDFEEGTTLFDKKYILLKKRESQK